MKFSMIHVIGIALVIVVAQGTKGVQDGQTQVHQTQTPTGHKGIVQDDKQEPLNKKPVEAAPSVEDSADVAGLKLFLQSFAIYQENGYKSEDFPKPEDYVSADVAEWLVKNKPTGRKRKGVFSSSAEQSASPPNFDLLQLILDNFWREMNPVQLVRFALYQLDIMKVQDPLGYKLVMELVSTKIIDNLRSQLPPSEGQSQLPTD